MPKRPQNQPAAPAKLVIPRAEAEKKISAQIEVGKELRARPISSAADLERAREDRTRWSARSSEVLRRIVDSASLVEEYVQWYGTVSFLGETSLAEDVAEFREFVSDRLNRLQSILERLDLIPEPETAPLTQRSGIQSLDRRASRKVFVVHGRDEAGRDGVARFLTKLGLEPIILHEQPNRGATIIEKFERHSGDVAFAVIVLSPDDVGGLAEQTRSAKLSARARQNVIFEFGFFCGALGRKNVCALLKTGVEKPSDIDGVVYVLFDDAGAWQLQLAREVKAAGLTVDLNNAV